MKTITIPDFDLFNEETSEFIPIKGCKIVIEHSLVSISKWESKWNKPFLDKNTEKTNEELIDYIKCMTITQNVNPIYYEYLPTSVIKEINDYIEAPMTATKFSEDKFSKGGRASNNEFITNELIYYWMITCGIPVEFEKWHINRLLTLIRVCNTKNAPEKKMSKQEILRRNHELNKARKAKLNTTG